MRIVGTWALVSIVQLMVLCYAVGDARADDPTAHHLARTAIDSADPDEAVEVSACALQRNNTTKEFTSEQRRALQRFMFMKLQNAFKAAMSSLSESALAMWIAKKEPLVLPHMPTPHDFATKGYSGELDFAPVFLVAAAFAHCAKDDFKECRTLFERGRSFRFARFSDKAVKSAYEDISKKTEKALASSDPYTVGKYVTNQGVLQQWIGRIVERKKTGLRVRITYASEGGSFDEKRSQVIEFVMQEVKPLTAVSADALLKGYR